MRRGGERLMSALGDCLWGGFWLLPFISCITYCFPAPSTFCRRETLSPGDAWRWWGGGSRLRCSLTLPFSFSFFFFFCLGSRPLAV